MSPLTTPKGTILTIEATQQPIKIREHITHRVDAA